MLGVVLATKKHRRHKKGGVCFLCSLWLERGGAGESRSFLVAKDTKSWVVGFRVFGVFGGSILRWVNLVYWAWLREPWGLAPMGMSKSRGRAAVVKPAA